MIPKIIHQIWLGDKNKPPLDWMKTYKEACEKSGWKYYLWTDDNIPLLINQDIFDNEERLHTKGNLVRYEMVYKYGGIHCDTDSVLLKLPEDLLDNDFFGCYESEKWTGDLVPSCFFGAEAGNPILKELIDEMKNQDQSKASWQFNGTQYFTDVTKKHNAKIYPDYYFNPVHFRDDRNDLDSRRRVAKAYTNHFWATTKNKWKTNRK